MKKLLIIIYAALSLNTNILAQSDYRPGFVILNNNDTIDGLIDFNGDYKNENLCRFKFKAEDRFTEYKPFEIVGYRFLDDKFYISKEININGKKENKFLEFLVHGIVDLYSYREINGVHFFIQKESEGLIELKKTEYKTFVDGNEFIRKDLKYIGLLKYLFADAPEIQNEIELVNVDRKSLTYIAVAYHEEVCKERKCIIYKKKLPATILNIGPLVGANRLSIDPEILRIASYGKPDLYDCNFDKSYSLSYGLFATILIPYTNDKIHASYEGLINSNSFSSIYSIIDKSGEISSVHNFSLNSTDLSHNLFLRYDILKSKLHPTIQIGGFINQKIKLKKTGIMLDHRPFDIFRRDAFFGLSIGLGLAYQIKENRDILLNISYNKGFGSFVYFNTQQINFTLAIPVFLFKLN